MKRTRSIILAAGGLVLLAAVGQVSAGLFDDWARTAEIRFTGYSGSPARDALTNFTALVKLSTNIIDGFSYDDFESASYNELRFSDATGLKELPYEVEKWDTGGTSYVWVTVGRITDANSDIASVHAYWGKAGEASAPVYTSNGDPWTNEYAGVWHMNEATGATVLDSTPNAVNGTPYNSPAQTAGKIVGSLDFNGSSSYVSLLNKAVLDVGGAGSWEMWLYTSNGGQTGKGLFVRDNSSVNSYKWIGGYLTGTSGSLYSYVRVGGTAYSAGTSGGAGYFANEWHHLFATFDRTLSSQRLKVYIDGKLAGNNDAANGDVDAGAVTYMGRWGSSAYYDGQLDEIRVSGVARSADWAWATFMNTASNETAFMTYEAAASTSLPSQGFTNRVAITIDYTKIDSDLTDWTLVFDQSFTNMFASVNGPLDLDGTSSILDGGGDIRFSSDPAGSERLAVDIRTAWPSNDPATASIELAVKVPSVSSTADTRIYMWWGEAGAAQPAAGDTYGQYDAYDANYVAVYPLTENPATAGAGGIKDRTSNQNNGTAQNMEAGDLVDGAVGNAFNFGGIDEHVNIPADASMEFALASSFTIEAIVDVADTLPGSCVFGRMDADEPAATGYRGYDLFVSPTEPEVAMHRISNWGGNDARKGEHAWPTTFNQWLWCVGIDEGGSGDYTKQKIYVNGVPRTVVDGGSGKTLTSSDTTPVVGAKIAARSAGAGLSNILEGKIDEIRLSNVERTAAWLKANYHNQVNTADFLVFGPVQVVEPDSDIPPTIVNLPATNVTTSSAWAHADLDSTGTAATVVFIYWGDEEGSGDGTGWDNTNSWSADFWGEGDRISTNLTGLAGNDTHYYTFAATNAAGADDGGAAKYFITGEVTVNATKNGTEVGPVDGEFTVSRPAGTADEDIEVSYVVDTGVADAAVPGTDYTALSGTVTLPSSSLSVTVPVAVQTDYTTEPTEVVRVVITNGLYVTGAPPSSAEVLITNKPSSNAGSIWWRNRDNSAGGYVENPYWDELQTVINDAMGGASGTGMVKMHGNFAREISSQTSLRILNGGYVRVSGGWNWPGGGAEPTLQTNRSTLNANSGGADSAYNSYSGLKDVNHFTVYNSADVILDGMRLINGRPELDWPSGRTAEPWGAAIRVVKANNTTLSNLDVSYNHISGAVGAGEYNNGGSIAVRADTDENWNQLLGFRMSDCEIHHNGENDSYAAGVTLKQVGSDTQPAIIENCSFYSNRGNQGVALNVTASTDSGGVRNRVLLANCRIWNNRGAQLIHTETTHVSQWNNGGGGGTGGYEDAGVTPNQRVTLFGSLVAGNYCPVGTWAMYTVLNYSEGLTHNEGFAIVNSTVVSNYNIGDASRWGRIYTDDRGSSGDNLWFINSIVQDFNYIQLNAGANADLQATTFSTDGSGYKYFYAAGTAGNTNWTVLADAVTQQDEDGAYRFFNRNDTTGARESAMGSNRQGLPGFVGAGIEFYDLTNNAVGKTNTIDMGLTRTESGFRYVDVNFDGDYDVGWDIIVYGSTNSPAGIDLVYTKDFMGNDRLRGKGSLLIDRGAYEAAPPPPPVTLFLLH